MVSSAHTILRPRARIPSTPSTLFQFVLLEWEKDENKQKEAGIGPFKKLITQKPYNDVSIGPAFSRENDTHQTDSIFNDKRDVGPIR